MTYNIGAEERDNHEVAISYLHTHRDDAGIKRLLKKIRANRAVGNIHELHRFVGLEPFLQRLAKMQTYDRKLRA